MKEDFQVRFRCEPKGETLLGDSTGGKLLKSKNN